jgi:C4-dicarboxylate-binding protein DctP
VIVNTKFWSGLPPDVRAGLESAMKDATAFEHQVAGKDNEDAMAAVEKSGKTKVIHLTAEQRAVWARALAPVRDEVAGRVGKDVIEEIVHEQAAAGLH